MTSVEHMQEVLDSKTRKWWFFALLILSLFLLPPYASKGFHFTQWGNIIDYTFRQALFFSWKAAFPVFQVIAMGFVLTLICFRNKASRFFCLYAGVSHILFAVLQCIAITSRYGVSIVTTGVVWFLFIAGLWFWEGVVGRNDFSQGFRICWKYLLFLPALLAFWLPISWTTGRPDFAPVYFLTSGSALTFCMMTPVYLAILIFFYPRVNLVILRGSGLIGIIVGLFNVIPALIPGTRIAWWLAVLHLPLLLLSILGLALSMRQNQGERHNKSGELT